MSEMRPKVVICSPFKAGQGFTNDENVLFAYRLCQLALSKGYNPLAPHLHYTQFMEDGSPTSRAHGIRMGMEWGYLADEAWICLRNLEHLTEGMQRELDFYREQGLLIRHMTFLPSGQFLSERRDDVDEG